MTDPDRWQLDDEGRLKFRSDELDAFALLFPDRIDWPVLTPAELTQAFATYLGGFTDGRGAIPWDDRAIISRTLELWRQAIEESRRALERAPLLATPPPWNKPG